MKLIKRYEERLDELSKQKILIEKEIEWVKELLDTLRKEEHKTGRLAELRPEVETDEFTNSETAEAARLVLQDTFPNEMHQKDIAREMFRRGWRCGSKTPDQTVATALFRLMQRNQNIEKTGKGTFRLKKLPKDMNSKEYEEDSKEEIPFQE